MLISPLTSWRTSKIRDHGSLQDLGAHADDDAKGSRLWKPCLN